MEPEELALGVSPEGWLAVGRRGRKRRQRSRIEAEVFFMHLLSGSEAARQRGEGHS